MLSQFFNSFYGYFGCLLERVLSFLRLREGDDDVCTLAAKCTDDNDVDGVKIPSIDFFDRLALCV